MVDMISLANMISLILAILTTVFTAAVYLRLIRRGYPKIRGVREKTEILNLGKVGVSKEVTFDDYLDFLKGEQELARLIKGTRRYLDVMGITLRVFLGESDSFFVNSLESIGGSGIPIRILLTDPSHAGIRDYRKPDAFKTLLRISELRRNVGKIQVAVSSDVPVFGLVMNESAAFLSLYETHSARSRRVMLIKEKEFVSLLRNHYNHIWDKSKKITRSGLDKLSEDKGLEAILQDH